MELVTADVTAYWRDVVGPERWFDTVEDLDREIVGKFLHIWHMARAGSLDAWRATPEGALALLLLLDQFPRRMFRDTRDRWRSERLACEIAGQAIEAGFDRLVDVSMQQFFYLPLVHSENRRAQARGVALMEEHLPEVDLSDARARQAVIARFGRLPWRNALQGRYSSDEEACFLWAGGYDWALRAQRAV